MPTNGSATPASPTDEVGQDAHLYVTLDESDEQTILELVRVEGDSYYVRDNGAWIPVDPDADDAPVWGRAEDVTPEAVNVYDLAAKTAAGRPTLADIEANVIRDEGDSQ